MSSYLTLASHIVKQQASVRPIPPDELKSMLKLTMDALKSCAEGTDFEPSLTELRERPWDSIGDTHVVCLECGKSFKMINFRHLAMHDLDKRTYKKKWGIALTQSLSCKTLSTKRRRISQKYNLVAAMQEGKKSRRKKAK